MGEQENHRFEEVKDQAAAWVIRLADPDCPPSDREAFEQWRALGLDHEVAYEREAATWEALDRLRAVYPAAQESDAACPSRRPAWSSPPRWIAAAAASVMLALGIGAAVTVSIVASPAYATGIGERRTVVLSDGSRIELNTDSKVVVRYRHGIRQVELERGEALFDVAKGDARPFVVLADHSEIRAGVSQVAVRLEPQGAIVRVKEGAADVIAPDASGSAGHPVHVAAGYEAMDTLAQPMLRPVSTEEMDRVLAWRQGGIAFDGQTLAEAVAEFDRYNRQQISIADNSIRGIRIGGYFQSSDLPGFVNAVTNTFPVRATQGSEGSVYLARKSGGPIKK